MNYINIFNYQSLQPLIDYFFNNYWFLEKVYAERKGYKKKEEKNRESLRKFGDQNSKR